MSCFFVNKYLFYLSINVLDTEFYLSKTTFNSKLNNTKVRKASIIRENIFEISFRYIYAAPFRLLYCL